MANEIVISSVTGLTPSIQLYSGGVAIGIPFAAAEIGSTGEYIASMPSGIPYGRYLVLVTVGSGVKIGSDEISWDGHYEITEGMAKMMRLDPSNPLVVTQTTMVAGAISIGITGDGETSSTFTRVS